MMNCMRFARPSYLGICYEVSIDNDIDFYDDNLLAGENPAL